MYHVFIDYFDIISHSVLQFLKYNVIFSAILFVIIYPVTIFIKKRSLYWQIGLWTLILTRLLLPPDLSHTYSGRAILNQLSVVKSAYSWFSGIIGNAAVNDRTNYSYDGFSFDELSKQDKNQIILTNNHSVIHRHITRTLFLLWLTGSLILLWYYVKRLSKYHYRIKHADIVEDPITVSLTVNWRRLFGIRRKIRLVCSETCLSPFTTGILRPVIHIPQCVIQKNDRTLLESTIAHEMTHIKRFDDLWIKVQNVIQIIYFFHPVVWIVNSKINLARECLCDSMALTKKEITISSYGKGMMTFLQMNLFGSEEIHLLPNFGNERKKMLYRIQHLKGAHHMKKYQSIFIVLTLTLIGIFILPMANSILTPAKSINYAAVLASENVDNDPPGFMPPLKDARLSSSFGNARHPYTKRIIFHTGIDLAAKEGTVIYASADGTVKEVVITYKKNEGPGKSIEISHKNGYSTRYTHLGDILIKEGQQVTAGQEIAKVGVTGLTTGPHLHFEIRANDAPQDPAKYIDLKNYKKK